MDQLKGYFFKYFIDIYRKNYANFEGRARRQEYWFFMLFYNVATFLIGFLDGLFGTEADYGFYSIGLLGAIFSLASFVPMIALATRRMHDLDKSGWWQLIVIVPIVGWIWFFILTVLEGTRGANRFGADPLFEANTTSTIVPPEEN